MQPKKQKYKASNLRNKTSAMAHHIKTRHRQVYKNAPIVAPGHTFKESTKGKSILKSYTRKIYVLILERTHLPAPCVAIVAWTRGILRDTCSIIYVLTLERTHMPAPYVTLNIFLINFQCDKAFLIKLV